MTRRTTTWRRARGTPACRAGCPNSGPSSCPFWALLTLRTSSAVNTGVGNPDHTRGCLVVRRNIFWRDAVKFFVWLTYSHGVVITYYENKWCSATTATSSHRLIAWWLNWFLVCYLILMVCFIRCCTLCVDAKSFKYICNLKHMNYPHMITLKVKVV